MKKEIDPILNDDDDDDDDDMEGDVKHVLYFQQDVLYLFCTTLLPCKRASHLRAHALLSKEKPNLSEFEQINLNKS